ncbi:MAG: FecR domain-containing protein [Candidatus Peribacteraceae bacterium]|nr:FecR domain-containing protein [Candidatus Peribacteraceae bacterium]
MFSNRHRHGFYPLAQSSPKTRVIRSALGVVLLLILLYIVGSWTLDRFGIGTSTKQTAVALAIEKRGVTQVSLDGSDFTQAETDLKLYSSDRVKTGPNSSATLTFFDGTMLRLAERTDLSILKSDLSTKESTLSVELHDGTLWILTPTRAAFSGAIVRTIETSALTFALPSRTEAVLAPRAVTVFAADGLGIQASIPRVALPIIIGEGQQFSLPESASVKEDLYQYRSPLDSRTLLSSFVEESRSLVALRESGQDIVMGSGALTGGDTNAILTVTNPANDSTVLSATVKVEGQVSRKVASVRINGYLARIDDAKRTFSQELTLPDEDEVSITVEALDEQGNVLEKTLRRLTRDRKPPAPPAFTVPAKTGETYRTQQTELVIRGSAPQDAIGIVVNDYRLQLFKPESGEWSYLASTKLANFQEGENIFTAYAINAGGYQSDPVTLTIILGGEGEGVIARPATQTGAAVSSAKEVTEAELPQNAPLLPGTLTVTGPTPGAAHTATGSSLLLEGTVPKETASVWVNGYKLRLYTAGKTFWNYIADVQYGTLKKGMNTYVINARNAEGKILDTLTYTVTY